MQSPAFATITTIPLSLYRYEAHCPYSVVQVQRGQRVGTLKHVNGKV